jgi:hypothetical protein
MDIPDELFELYSKLVDKIYSDKDFYSEQELSTFTPGIGENYQNGLMVVGRAVNGWGNKIDKTNIQYRDTVLIGIRKCLAEDNLQWVIDQWGGNHEVEYNPNKSAFWRLIRKLSEELIEQNDEVINKIVWSNLYKISKAEQGNPSGGLMDIQFEICRDILKFEIELFKPKIIVFLTGWSWAGRFLIDIPTIQIKNDEMEYVEFVGKVNSSLIIVAQHPQGKAEYPHLEEIIQQIKLFNDYTV